MTLESGCSVRDGRMLAGSRCAGARRCGNARWLPCARRARSRRRPGRLSRCRCGRMRAGWNADDARRADAHRACRVRREPVARRRKRLDFGYLACRALAPTPGRGSSARLHAKPFVVGMGRECALAIRFLSTPSCQ
ncbi:hypothetical protein FE789_29575 [Burkholderia pseudomallei]|nr:hypothetical protein FE789_29575 [Burkholderia pseudomallei]